MPSGALAGLLTLAALPAQTQARPLLEPKLLSTETYGETFSLVADLGERGYVQAQVAFSNLGPADHYAACRFMVIQPDKPTWSAAQRFDREQWRVDNNNLHVGPCHLEAADSLKLVAPLEGGTLALTLHERPKAVQPPQRRLDLDDGFYEVDVLVPWAKATLVLQRDGKSREVTGFGYADHSRSTALPNRIARLWVRFRALDAERSQLLLLRFPAGNGAAKGWYWSAKTDGPAPIRRAQAQRAPGKDLARPWRARIQTQDELLQIRTTSLLNRHAPVEEYGFMGRIVSAIVGNPVTYTFRGQLRRKGEPPLSGILEVTIPDE